MTDLSKIRKDYLKLSKAKLTKKCKAQKLEAYGTKAELVDLLIKQYTKKLSHKKTKQNSTSNKLQTASLSSKSQTKPPKSPKPSKAPKSAKLTSNHPIIIINRKNLLKMSKTDLIKQCKLQHININGLRNRNDIIDKLLHFKQAITEKQHKEKLKRNNHQKIANNTEPKCIKKTNETSNINIKSVQQILEDNNNNIINTKSSSPICQLDDGHDDNHNVEHLNAVLSEIEDKKENDEMKQNRIDDEFENLKKKMIEAINVANLKQQELYEKIKEFVFIGSWQWKTKENKWISFDDELCETIEQLNIGESHRFLNENDNNNSYIIIKNSKENAVQSMESVDGIILSWQCRRSEVNKAGQNMLNENKEILESLKVEIINALQEMSGNRGISVIWQWKSANNKWVSYGDEISEEIDALDINQHYEYLNRNIIIKNTVNTATHVFKLRFGESRTECRRIKLNVSLLDKLNDIKQKLINRNDEIKQIQQEYLYEKKRLSQEINEMKEKLINRDIESEELQKELEDKNNKISIQMTERIKMKNKCEEIRRIKRELNNKRHDLEEEKIKLKSKDDEIQRLKEELNNEQNISSSSLEQLSKVIREQEVEIEDLTKKNDLYFDKVIDIEKKRDEQVIALKNNEVKLKEKDGVILSYIDEIESIKKQLKYQKSTISTLDNIITKQKREIKELKMDTTITKMRDKDDEINRLKEKLTDQQSTLCDKDKIIIKQQEEIRRLKISIPNICKINAFKVDGYECRVMKEAINAFKECFNDIPSEFIEASHNKCYCNGCHSVSNEEIIYFRGEPSKKYVLPIGWTRVGIKVDKGKCKMNNVWDDWHVAFHGTDGQSLKEVFKSGLQLLKPGDMTINGNALSMKPGHIEKGFNRYNHYTKTTELFDPNQIFMTPSIKYASNTIYAKKYELGNGDKVQFVLQLRIRPKSYNVGHETIGATTDGIIIDKNYNNNELEWYTKENVGIIIHGLLIRIEKKKSYK